MSTHFTGTSEEINALDCFIKLLRAANSVNAAASKQIQNAKLTESQFGILEALLHLGPLTQKQLAEKILKSGGNITLVIENLLKLGLVKKEKHKDDQRCFWISLTTNGDNLVKKLFPNHVKIITERLSVLSTNEQALLASLCRKLGKNEQV